MAEAVVEHDYVAQESDELTIKKGDIIYEVVKKQGGWWEGTLNHKRGMFPDNFVRLIDKDNEVTLRSRKESQRIRQCRVVYSYTPAHEDELMLKVGDVIDIVGEEEEGWWRGRLNEKEGVFPSNFVEEIKMDSNTLTKANREENNGLAGETDSNSPSLPPKPSKIFCQAKFAYQACNDDELTLKEGDRITLISKEGQDPGWWKGELRGRIGVFPDNFVVLLSSPSPSSAANDTVQQHSNNNAHNHDATTATKDDKKVIKSHNQTQIISPKPTAPTPTQIIKPNTVAQQRKSLELKAEEKTSPPVPGKKPSLPIKKSPSGSGGAGGLFSGIKKRIADAVDGSVGSKSASQNSNNVAPVLLKHESVDPENAFDQVERSSMLSDPRATRAKAPGRRPPSMVFREGEPGIVNGNSTEHNSTTTMESLHESSSSSSTTTINNSSAVITSSSTISMSSTTMTNNNEAEAPQEVERKPRLREWEKHKAPWFEELKQNQAKRTSTSPGPPDRHKSNEKLNEKEPQPDNMSKSMSAMARLKTPPQETNNDLTYIMLRSKNSAPATPVRPHTLQNINNSNDVPKGLTPSPKPISNDMRQKEIGDSAKVTSSPISSSITHQLPPHPPTSVDSSAAHRHSSSSNSAELLDRIANLESRLEQHIHASNLAIEELKAKLQLETEMRMLLQAELERITQSHCVVKV